MRLVKLSSYIDHQYGKDSRPTPATVRRRIEHGDEVPPCAVHRKGKRYYIDLDRLNEDEVSMLVDRILAAS